MKKYFFDEVTSTNDKAKEIALLSRNKENFFVLADYQSSGKGTKGRKWSSPMGKGIYLSIVHFLNDNLPLSSSTIYAEKSAEAIVKTLNKIYDIKPDIKPVNDIYFNGKKLAGILIETRLEKSNLSFIITGIGINIYKTIHEIDRGNIEPISLEEILDSKIFKDFSKENLITELVNEVTLTYQNILKMV